MQHWNRLFHPWRISKLNKTQSWMNVVLVTVPLWARGGTRCCLDLTSKQHFHDLMGLCNFCPTKQPRGSLHYQQHWQMLRKITAISPSAILAPLKILWIECETLQRWNMVVITFWLIFVDQCSPCPCEPWSFEVVSVLKMTLSQNSTTCTTKSKPGEFIHTD